MKKITTGILAASILGAGALGTGLALNANASEYEQHVEYENVRESTFSYMGDDSEASIQMVDGIMYEFREDDRDWEITDQDGNVIDYGSVDGDPAVVSISSAVTIDDDGNEIKRYPTEVIIFDTEEEFEAWQAENQAELESPGVLSVEDDDLY